jgi:hypothetical protein
LVTKHQLLCDATGLNSSTLVNGYAAIISIGSYAGVSIAASTFVINSSQSTLMQQYHLKHLTMVSSLAALPELCKFTTLTFSEALTVECQSYNVE